MMVFLRIIFALWLAGYWISQITFYCLKHEYHTAGYSVIIGMMMVGGVFPPNVGKQ